MPVCLRVQIKEVLAEVKDENARMVLETMATELVVREVDPEALKFVTGFSKLTGDYPRLSAVDLKVMALTYQLEKQFNGTSHLNTRPKPAVQPKPQPETGGEDKDLEGFEEAVNDRVEESAASGGGVAEEDEGELDPSEFERKPLVDDDAGWARPVRKGTASETGSVKSSATHATTASSAARKKAKQLPGWYDGEDDDEGWITPETIKEEAPIEVQEREVEDDRVACATTDQAMQNVLMQIGLRVLDDNGQLVSTVKHFVSKCHACFKICKDTQSGFCPHCGNATMMRVSQFVQADGTITYSKGIKSFSTRGTKYSLPAPQFGRHKDDLVLREDQLLTSKHRRRKPKAVLDEDGFTTFTNRVDMKLTMGEQEIIGMGYAGGGRKNPNSRRGCGR